MVRIVVGIKGGGLRRRSKGLNGPIWRSGDPKYAPLGHATKPSPKKDEPYANGHSKRGTSSGCKLKRAAMSDVVPSRHQKRLERLIQSFVIPFPHLARTRTPGFHTHSSSLVSITHQPGRTSPFYKSLHHNRIATAHTSHDMSSPRQSRTPTGSPPPRRDRSERSRSPIRDRSSAPSPHFPWPETPITSGPSVPHHHHATPRGNAFTTFIVRRRGSQPTTDGQLPPSSAELQSGPPAPVGSLPDALAIPDLINDQSAGVDELDLDIRPFSPPPAFPLPPPGLFGIPSVGIRPAQTTASNDQNPEGPRMPWQGAIPSFFIMGGDGSLVPHFELPPQLQPHPHTILHNPADGPQRRPVEFFFPFGLAPAVPTAPDPEKAKERLRSLKGVQLRLMKRVDRIVLAEEDELEVEEGNEKGWKCGICLDGWESQDKGLDDEVGVKALPCNHLFHEQCLEPWFATNYTW
jgi:hypothetical protein